MTASVRLIAMAIAVMTGLTSVTVVAQSPSPEPSAGTPSPAASPATPSGAPLATPVGPITWTRVTNAKVFSGDPEVDSVGQLPDGRLVVVGSLGSVGDAPDQSKGAAWSSTDGKKWARLKIKAPKGSTITTIASLGETSIATGYDDGGGLLWTSADGTTWTSVTPPSGEMVDVETRTGGLIGAGAEGGGPAVWLTTDGLTWQEQSLAPSGYATHVAVGPDGVTVVAGVVGVGQDRVPTVWSSADGVTWVQEALPGLAPGSWSVPAMSLTPVGYVLTLSEQGQTGAIGHVWVSPDGVSWQETLVDEAGTLSVVGTAGIDALLIGHDQVLRSPDGLTWTPTDEPSFADFHVWDLMTLADGRLFAAGDIYRASMAVWIGEAAPAP